MDPKVIVSLTTHDLRLTNGTVERVIKNILDGTFKDLRVVLTLYKDDESLIPASLRKMIDDGSIELIVSDINLRPHLKYFYAMQKYRNLPVITIDDDILYPDDMVEKLYKRWTENPRYIIARRSFPIVTTYYGELTRYATWMAQGLIKSEAPLMAAFPTGVGGILYPPDCLQLSDADIPEINTILTDDDFYLKAIEVRKGIRTITIEHNEADLYKKNLDDPVTQSIALFNQNAIGGSDKSILKYRSDFIEASKHNVELPIISLTSWKGRIDRVYLTILSILTNCPGFKIVLVLSEEEFPRREEELPKELKDAAFLPVNTIADIALRQDIDLVISQIPEYYTSIGMVRDAICESDVVTGRLSRDLKFDKADMPESETENIIAKIEDIEEKLELHQIIKNHMVLMY